MTKSLKETLHGHAERHGIDSTIDLMIAETNILNAEIAALKAEVERVTEVARLLVGECEEQRECPICGTDTNVELCRPSCYVAKMRKVLDDKRGGG